MRPGYGLSGLCLAFSDTLYNVTFPENSEIMKNICRVCFSPKLTKHLSRLMTKKDSFQVELCQWRIKELIQSFDVFVYYSARNKNNPHTEILQYVYHIKVGYV